MVIVMAAFRRILILVVDQIGKAGKLWMQGTLFGRTLNFDWAIAELSSFSGREIFASLPDQPAACLPGFR